MLTGAADLLKFASLSSEESETNSFYFQDKTQVNFFSNWKCLVSRSNILYFHTYLFSESI